MPNVFISYSRRDRERVIQLADALQGEGLSVWWDPNLVPGRKFRQMIAEQLAAADCVVVVWTAASLESDWVQDEAEEARVRGVLLPVMMDPVKAPAGFRQVQAADLSQWTGNPQHPEFRALVQAAKTLAQMARSPGDPESTQPGQVLADPEPPPRPPVATPVSPVVVESVVHAPPETAPLRPTAPPSAVTAGDPPIPAVGNAFARFGSRVFDIAAKPAVWIFMTLATLAMPMIAQITDGEVLPLFWLFSLTPSLGGVLAMAARRHGVGASGKAAAATLAIISGSAGLVKAAFISGTAADAAEAYIYIPLVGLGAGLGVGALVALSIGRGASGAALP